jgi:hypothetical protein
MLFFVVVFSIDQTSRPNYKVFEYFRFILEFYDIFDFFLLLCGDSVDVDQCRVRLHDIWVTRSETQRNWVNVEYEIFGGISAFCVDSVGVKTHFVLTQSMCWLSWQGVSFHDDSVYKLNKPTEAYKIIYSALKRGKIRRQTMRQTNRSNVTRKCQMLEFFTVA